MGYQFIAVRKLKVVTFASMFFFLSTMAEKTVCFTIIYETENQKPVSRMGSMLDEAVKWGVFLSGDTA